METRTRKGTLYDHLPMNFKGTLQPCSKFYNEAWKGLGFCVEFSREDIQSMNECFEKNAECTVSHTEFMNTKAANATLALIHHGTYAPAKITPIIGIRDRK